MTEYDKLVSEQQLIVDGMSVKVHCPWWKVVEIRMGLGQSLNEEHASGIAEFRLWLQPNEVDDLIRRLMIAKEALLEYKENAD